MKKQFWFSVKVVHKNGTTETLDIPLKPHLGLGNATDLYLSLKKSSRYDKVNYPELQRIEHYQE